MKKEKTNEGRHTREERLTERNNKRKSKREKCGKMSTGEGGRVKKRCGVMRTRENRTRETGKEGT